MAQANVYLSDELAEAVKRHSLSVSSICQQALAAEVKKAEVRMSITDDLEQVATRLRATRAEDDIFYAAEGRANGIDFARRLASLADLEDMESQRDFGPDHWRFSETTEEIVSRKNFADGYDSPTTATQYTTWLVAFVDGALEVLEEVRPLLH